ncbi:MAG: D-alanyl-D-alanine carboxypeptidase, partial [Limnohabitans sp.]
MFRCSLLKTLFARAAVLAVLSGSLGASAAPHPATAKAAQGLPAPVRQALQQAQVPASALS